MRSVTIRVPASTSNLGSGFDTLGLAVNLYNTLRVTRHVSRSVKITSPIQLYERASATRLIRAAGNLFFQRVQLPKFGYTVGISGDVPQARGLGASATIRVGIVAALNELCARPLSRRQLVELVTDLEGHPDNASPAVLGGFTVSGRVGEAVRCLRFRVSPRVRLVTLIPHFGMSTAEARKLLPEHYPKADTAHALNRTALISAALASENYPALRGLFDDRVHQPYREQLIPPLRRVIAAGERAGAIGGWLSGAGSSIMCLTLKQPETIARAMQAELPASEMLILRPDNTGFRILA